MEIVITSVDTRFACPELRDALEDAIPAVSNIAREYAGRKDDRTLVVLLACPCCSWSGHDELSLARAVVVSPFAGIDCHSYPQVHLVKKDPPYRTPGQWREAASIEEYLFDFRATLDGALAP
jgi:hypothetical protein